MIIAMRLTEQREGQLKVIVLYLLKEMLQLISIIRMVYEQLFLCQLL